MSQSGDNNQGQSEVIDTFFDLTAIPGFDMFPPLFDAAPTGFEGDTPFLASDFPDFDALFDLNQYEHRNDQVQHLTGEFNADVLDSAGVTLEDSRASETRPNTVPSNLVQNVPIAEYDSLPAPYLPAGPMLSARLDTTVTSMALPSPAAQADLLREWGGRIVALNGQRLPGISEESIYSITEYTYHMQIQLLRELFPLSFTTHPYCTRDGRRWRVVNDAPYGLRFVRDGDETRGSVTIALTIDELMALRNRTVNVVPVQPARAPPQGQQGAYHDYNRRKRAADTDVSVGLNKRIAYGSAASGSFDIDMIAPGMAHTAVAPPEAHIASVVRGSALALQSSTRTAPVRRRRVQPDKFGLTTTKKPINPHPDLDVDDICRDYPEDMVGGCILRTFEIYGKDWNKNRDPNGGGFYGTLANKLYTYHPSGFGQWQLPDTFANRGKLIITLRKSVEMARKGEEIYEKEAAAEGQRARCLNCATLHIDCQYREDPQSALPCRDCLSRGAVCVLPSAPVKTTAKKPQTSPAAQGIHEFPATSQAPATQFQPLSMLGDRLDTTLLDNFQLGFARPADHYVRQGAAIHRPSIFPSMRPSEQQAERGIPDTLIDPQLLNDRAHQHDVRFTLTGLQTNEYVSASDANQEQPSFIREGRSEVADPTNNDFMVMSEFTNSIFNNDNQAQMNGFDFVNTSQDDLLPEMFEKR